MEPGIFLVGGGWSDAHRDALWGPFLWRAAERAAGEAPRIACVVIDEGDGAEQVQRWADVLVRTAACTPVPVLIPSGSPLSDERRSIVAAAHGLLICGGLTPAYAESLAPAGDLIRAQVAAGVPYAGFSAGAAVAADRAVVGGWRDRGVPVCPEDAGEDLDEVTVVDGLGLVPFAVDVHAAQWGTLGRLVAAVAGGQVGSGMALDEDTVLQVALDGSATVAGAGRVHLVRPSGDGAGGAHVTSFAGGAPVDAQRMRAVSRSASPMRS
ncbi:Type 1 glutamine amidotransferase-like domain-containing protein [Nakamurella deserti]|uniref:Type 1 glutamine amidotransferase-like domain-containing protein n=1 Tax=Nakamurella deserti TaxID=2164074 RepID=UPI000DBE27D1|nr:Type 1 glutamine amidotransferase-like domain-containing protein [Nakamurella deserti]